MTPTSTIVLWLAIIAYGVGVLVCLIMGGWLALLGISLATNFVLSWRLFGHGNMLRALGLQLDQP